MSKKNNQTQKQLQNNKELEQKLNEELETIERVCFDYKKNKSFNTQIILTLFSVIILYCQQYVLKNNIDIGFSDLFIKYIGIGAIAGGIFGWISHYLEFHTTDFKYYKIGKCIIWVLELIMIIIFGILLFKG